MRIENLHLRNYRCFTELSVEFHPQMTVLVAPNGQGKTCVLDAIKVALWPYVAGFDLGSATNGVTSIQIDDVRREQVQSHESDWRLPVEINAKGQLRVRQLIVDGALNNPRPMPVGTACDIARDFNEDVPWQGIRCRESIKKGTKTKDIIMVPNDVLNLNETAKALEQRIFSGKQTKPDNLPMLGYYGTCRLWTEKKIKSGGEMYGEVNAGVSSRTFAYRDCLDPASSFKYFALWYTRIFKTYRAAQIRNFVKGLPLDADVSYGLVAPIKAVQQATDTMLFAHTGWRELEYSEEYEDLVLNHEQCGQLRVSQLSDGIRNMLALVGDIAYRCYKLNAHLGEKAPRLTHGVVLIDEVDMHLHPSWQQTVLTDLSAAFPKLQFIVTTHSPQVLSTVKRESIRIIGPDVSGKVIAATPLAMTYGEPSGDVLHSVMMVDPQPPVREKADLQRLTEWVDQGHYASADARQLMQALIAALGEQHPQLQRLQRSIQRQEALKQ